MKEDILCFDLENATSQVVLRGKLGRKQNARPCSLLYLTFLSSSSTATCSSNRATPPLENHNPVYVDYTDINYTLTVGNSCGERSKWLIVRRMGFSGKCSLPENVLNAYANGEIDL
jgi:hypothetical protein